MWPKLLFDLLPHFSRLIPMADKYLATRSASDKAQAAALAAMAEGLRGDLGQVTEAHEGLRRQMQEQGTQISELALEVTRSRLGVESTEARTAKLEKTAGMAMRLLWVGLGLLAIAVVLLIVLVVRVGH
jgi:chromosome segregation ATPase